VRCTVLVWRFNVRMIPVSIGLMLLSACLADSCSSSPTVLDRSSLSYSAYSPSISRYGHGIHILHVSSSGSHMDGLFGARRTLIVTSSLSMYILWSSFSVALIAGAFTVVRRWQDIWSWELVQALFLPRLGGNRLSWNAEKNTMVWLLRYRFQYGGNKQQFLCHSKQENHRQFMQKSAQRLPLYHEGVPRDYPQREYRAASTDAGCCEHHTRNGHGLYCSCSFPILFTRHRKTLATCRKCWKPYLLKSCRDEASSLVWWRFS